MFYFIQHSPLTLYDLKIGRAFVKPVSDQEQQQQLALDLGIQNQSNFPYYDIEKQESLEQKKCQYIICNFWVAIFVFGVIALICFGVYTYYEFELLKIMGLDENNDL